MKNLYLKVEECVKFSFLSGYIINVLEMLAGYSLSVKQLKGILSYLYTSPSDTTWVCVVTPTHSALIQYINKLLQLVLFCKYDSSIFQYNVILCTWTVFISVTFYEQWYIFSSLKNIPLFIKTKTNFIDNSLAW